jgi:hypothetical protein
VGDFFSDAFHGIAFLVTFKVMACTNCNHRVEGFADGRIIAAAASRIFPADWHSSILNSVESPNWATVNLILSGGHRRTIEVDYSPLATEDDEAWWHCCFSDIVADLMDAAQC